MFEFRGLAEQLQQSDRVVDGHWKGSWFRLPLFLDAQLLATSCAARRASAARVRVGFGLPTVGNTEEPTMKR